MKTRTWYKQSDELLGEIRRTELVEGSLALWSLGQAGFVLKIGGKVIYLDPLLTDLRTEEGSRRLFPPPFPPEKADADFILCSHDHADHLNLETLLPIAEHCPRAVFVVPAPYAGKLEGAGIPQERIIGAREEKPFSLGDGLICTPIAAAHEEYRTDPAGDQECLAFLIRQGDDLSLFHGGDTVVTPVLISRLQREHGIDVMLLPINGADWKRRQAGIIGNMDPRAAADLAGMAGADMVIPYHFDMVEGNTEDPALFAHYMTTDYGWKKFHIMALGERFLYCGS